MPVLKTSHEKPTLGSRLRAFSLYVLLGPPGPPTWFSEVVSVLNTTKRFSASLGVPFQSYLIPNSSRSLSASCSYLAHTAPKRSSRLAGKSGRLGGNEGSNMKSAGTVAHSIEARSSKYLNNIVEQDHCRIKQRIRPMLGFNRFETATITISGIELAEKIRK